MREEKFECHCAVWSKAESARLFRVGNPPDQNRRGEEDTALPSAPTVHSFFVHLRIQLPFVHHIQSLHRAIVLNLHLKTLDRRPSLKPLFRVSGLSLTTHVQPYPWITDSIPSFHR
jgi:hypothetical protein